MFLQKELYLFVRSSLLKSKKKNQPNLYKVMVNYIQNEYGE